MTKRTVWDERVRRAETLAGQGGPSAALLGFYGRVLKDQQALYAGLVSQPPSGAIEQDADLLAGRAMSLLTTVAASGPEPIVDQARDLLRDRAAIVDALREYWEHRSDRDFF